MGVQDKDPLVQLSLPPGFRFYPTDEELMVQYLCRKVAGHHFSLPIIGDIDLYKFDPWVLPGKAMFGEKEWYFFSPRDRKYPNGSRPNRVAGSGYWKATGTDKIITSEGRKVGIKKALVFYVGKAPKGSKTNWIMHEYRLFQSTAKSGGTKLDDWVLCRIYNKNSSASKPTTSNVSSPTSSYPGMGDQLVGFLGMSCSGGASNVDQKVPLGLPSFGSFDWGVWAGMNDGPEEGAFGLGQAQMMDQHHVGDHVTLPLLPPLCHVDSPEEVRGLRVNGSGDLFGQKYTGSGDPFAIRWPDMGLGNEWASVYDHMG